MLGRTSLAVLLLAGCPYVSPNGATTDAPNQMQPPDVLPDPELCTDTTTAECLGNTLRECRAVGQLPIDRLCAMCISTPDPHCETLVPSANGATAGDLAPDGTLVDITIENDARVDTSSGEIQGIRPAGTGVRNGIGFEIVGDIAVWRFHALTINANLGFQGDHAAVFAANRTIDVAGVLDVRGPCDFQTPGPGGSPGGGAEVDGGGDGKGLRGNGSPGAASGGSGGGHGTTGSAGGSGGGQAGPAGGGTFGDPTITMLRGGSGGGGGGGDLTSAGVGGGGGGALQLVANDRISFTATAGINAGGCGGRRVLVNGAAGGGGGAGGTILVEASQVELSTAVLAVNGGGGSGGDVFAGDGDAGRRQRQAATGGNGSGTMGQSGGRGGNGAFATTAATVGQSDNQNGGGGAGGLGRIRINTRDNTNLTGDCAGCSPNFTDANTTLTRGAANIQR